MSYIEPEDNLVDFPEKFLNLRDELDFTHEALLEDKEVERRVKILRRFSRKGCKSDAHGIHDIHGPELHLQVSGPEYR